MEISPSEFGHGKTRNLAVSQTTGEYAVLITHDALPYNLHWLAAMVALADSDPRIAGVFGRHCAYPEASPYTKRDLDGHFGNFAGQPVVWLDDKARYDRDEPYRQRLHFFSDNNALVRRSVWEQIPYPDVDFAEDQIWAQQIIEAGWKRAMRMMAWSTIRTISPCSKTAAQFRRIACAVSFVRLCLVTKRQAHAAHLAGVDTQRSRLCACRRLSSQPFRYCGQDAAPQPDASNRALPRLTRPTITGVRAQLASRDRRMMHGLPTSGWRTRKTQP